MLTSRVEVTVNEFNYRSGRAALADSFRHDSMVSTMRLSPLVTQHRLRSNITHTFDSSKA